MSMTPLVSRTVSISGMSCQSFLQERMWKTQSRPNTARPPTTNSVRQEGKYIIALLEGRGISREIGLAALEKDTGAVEIVQLADCQTYVKTLHQMHLHYPSVILVPDTFLSTSETSDPILNNKTASVSHLIEFIEEEFPGILVEKINRKYWNECNGLEFIQQLCVENEERPGLLYTTSCKYYALSACSALFRYAEMRLNTRYAPGSLRIRYSTVEGTMMIDPATIKNLELTGNIPSKKNSHSLFRTLNHTFTAMGMRLLRVNILSPITVQSAIDARLDAVEELIHTEDKFKDVQVALNSLHKVDLDKLIMLLASSEMKTTSTTLDASRRVSQMLNLRKIVKGLPLLRIALTGAHSSLLNIVNEMISDPRLEKIEQMIVDHLNEESSPIKHGIGAVNAKVYAIKANCNRLLDVARETYKENVGDIYTLCSSLSEEHGLPLALIYQETGFVFSLKKFDVEKSLPKEFINPLMKKGKWQFSSLDLKKINARMKDALDETLLLSDKLIQDLVARIVSDIGALYKVSEAVALVDILWSFANASIIRNYVRPEFTDTLAIKGARHPILETVQHVGTVVANDIYCDGASSFQVIQGPNMSGKSTYLRQVALLVVMAMCGCFVPAQYASFRIHDALLSRLSNDDDIEKGLSTFACEMATCAVIIGLATSKSLILMDELGRGTSPIEGMGIAHAIAEELIRHQSFVFFATHFTELAVTLSRQPSVISLHLSVQQGRPSKSNFGIAFQYKVLDGSPDDIRHYGIELARLADLPSDVLEESRRVAAALTALHTRNETSSESHKIANRRKALIKLCAQLSQALDHSTLPNDELLTYIARFQREFSKRFLYR